MTDALREAATKALDALENGVEFNYPALAEQAINALRAALAAPQPDQRLGDNETDPTVLWAEIHRLSVALRGPDGYASWQDAATDERVKRVRAEKALKEVTSAQPAQPEPVAWMSWHAGLPVGVTRHEDECNRWIGEGVPVTPLYAAPPTRTAVPLTDEEIDSIWFLTQSSPPKNWRHVVVRNIERAVWEKNGIGGGE